MNDKVIVPVVAIVCLTIIGFIMAYTLPDASKALYVVAGLIGAIAGVTLPSVPRAINAIRGKIKRGKTRSIRESQWF